MNSKQLVSAAWLIAVQLAVVCAGEPGTLLLPQPAKMEVQDEKVSEE